MPTPFNFKLPQALDPEQRTVFDGLLEGALKDASGVLGLDDLMGSAIDTVNPLAMAKIPAKAAQRAIQGVVKRSPVPKPIRAFHGSPAPPFEKFDINRIGEGEGAQAFGRGLFFAESPDVARFYRNALANEVDDKFVDAAGKEFSPTRLQRKAERVAERLGVPNPRKVAADARRFVAEGRQGTFDVGEATKEVLEPFQDLEFKRSGSLAEVDLNVTPEELLNLDVPLSQQGGVVKRGIQNMGFSSSDDPSGLEVLRGLEDIAKRRGITPIRALQEAGAQVPEIAKTQAANRARSQANLEDLRKQFLGEGIRGTQFLDEGSREVGEGGTRNFSIFDDEDITIIKQLMLLLGIGGGAASAIDEDQ